MRTSNAAGESRDTGNEVKAANKQEHCPHPFLDPAQAQEGVVEPKPKLTSVY